MTTSLTLPIAPEAPWLAPLAGFSDLPFRLLCREHGCRAAVTEMVSAKGLCYESAGTDELLETLPEDQPLVVQLFGSEIEYIERAMHTLKERGFQYFDLNAGCPVKKVVKTGSGAAMHKTPELLEAIARRMAEIAPGSTGVKFRRGWADGEENYIEIGKRLEDAGAAWVALHPRYAKQGYGGTAQWSCLARLREAITIPIIASGDLFSAEDGTRCIQETGVTGVMFARGALYGPQIFSDYMALLAGKQPAKRTGVEIAAIIRKHAQLARTYLPDRKALLKMRTVVPRYVRHMDGAKQIRARLVRLNDWAELEEILNDFLGNPCHP